MSKLSSHGWRWCSKAVRTSWLQAVVPLALVLVVMSCSDNQRTPVAPGPTPSDGPSFGVSESSNGVGACLLDDVVGAAYVNSGEVQCTSKDIDIAIAQVSEYSFTSAGGPFTALAPGATIACTPGQTIYVRTDAVLLNNAKARYDVGLWINPVAGGSALTGTNCTHYNLLISDDELGVSNLDNDQCGDVHQDQDTVIVPLDVLTLTCSDPTITDSSKSVLARAGRTQWANLIRMIRTAASAR